MASWLKALSKTRKNISSAIGSILGMGETIDEETLEELEETLLRADVPVRLVGKLMDDLQGQRAKETSHRDILRGDLVAALGEHPPFDWTQQPDPLTILIVGVNGSGKTTTTAKLAYQLLQQGISPLLGAGDTFRAAGSEQLKLWANMVGSDVVTGATGGDAAAIAFDAVDATIARKANVLLLDTAGRMHTKKPLMEELDKVRRAMDKRLPGAPHETWIVLDASIGQNALIQARMFHEIQPLSGVIVAKLDGSAKAGFLFAVTQELGVPVRFAGLGEQKEDLVPFDPVEFVDALLGIETPVGSRDG